MGSAASAGAGLLSLLCLLLWALRLAAPAQAAAMGDDCDWSGSGLAGPERAVSPVYLRCAQGRLRWAYPRGALRVLLRLGGAEFRACVRLAPGSAGARLFLEGPRALQPLFEPGTGPGRVAGPSDPAGPAPEPQVRCFRSRGGQAALYVESLPRPPEDFSKLVAAFAYDLQPLGRSDAADECRPCSEQEMARAFCSSDVVARGQVHGAMQRPELGTTELRVRVNKLLRHSSPTVLASRVLSVHVVQHCGAQPGTAELVLMARHRLGDLALTCAPQLHEWAAVARRLQVGSAAPCVLAT